MGPVLGINYVTTVGNGIDAIQQEIQDEITYYETIPYISASGGVYGRTGFNAGLYLNYYFIDNIAFYSNLSYSQKGYMVKNSYELTTGYDYKIKEEIHVNLDYLDFPLCLKYRFKNGIALSGGMLLSFLGSDKVITESTEIYETPDSISGNIIMVNEYTSIKEDYNDVIDIKKPIKILTGFQIGISYTIKRFDFGLLLNKNTSFGNIQNISNNKNITFQFQLGYILKKNRSSKKKRKIDTI